MPEYCPVTGWLHYTVSRDLIEMIDRGLIWRLGPHAQERAVRAILAGDAKLNDKVPPAIRRYIERERSQAPRGFGP